MINKPMTELNCLNADVVSINLNEAFLNVTFMASCVASHTSDYYTDTGVCPKANLGGGSKGLKFPPTLAHVYVACLSMLAKMPTITKSPQQQMEKTKQLSHFISVGIKKEKKKINFFLKFNRMPRFIYHLSSF